MIDDKIRTFAFIKYSSDMLYKEKQFISVNYL